jgi:hypothetical protein
MKRDKQNLDKGDGAHLSESRKKLMVWGGNIRKKKRPGKMPLRNEPRVLQGSAFPLSLSFAHFDERIQSEHDRAKFVLQLKPELCVSHTILIIDSTGSMWSRDIGLYRRRRTSVYIALALDFVAEQLSNETANSSDVVTLIEIKDIARVLYLKEPMTWAVLYNALLARRYYRTF